MWDRTYHLFTHLGMTHIVSVQLTWTGGWGGGSCRGLGPAGDWGGGGAGGRGH